MKTMYYTIPGYIYFLYILFPLRLWERFVFSNQTEVVVVTLFFACVMLLFTLLKAYQTFSFHLSKIDLMLIIYGIYLLFRFRYPLEKEIFYQAFSITCIYLYFRNFPEKYLTGLFFLLPIAVMIQMLDGVNRFTMPWQNLSHITGIFNNTGLFGGFAALGFVVCAGLFLFTGSGKCNLKTDSCLLRSSQFAIVKSAVLFILCIILSIQAYASGSRASWVAALIAISFLLYWLVLPSLRGALATKQSGIVFFLFVSCLIVITIFFSNYLYHLKKDSADGRLLIARVSMGMVKGSPVFGNGISGFRAEYLNQQADYFRTHSDSTWADLADDVESPFNEFLKVLIEQGIAGVLLFSYLLYSLFEKGAAKNPHCYILQSIVLFILIFGLFSYPLDNLPFVALFVLSIAGLSRNRNPVFTVRISKSKYLRIPLLISLCIVSGIIAVNACLYAKSCLKWNKTLANFASDKEKALSQLEILYPELENNPVFLTTYGKALGFGKHYSDAITVLEKAVKRQPLSASYIELGKSYEAAGLPAEALASWNQASLMVPSRFAPLYLTMNLYFKNREYDRAQEYAGQLLTKKVKIDNPEIDKMKRDARDILNGAKPP